MDKLWYIHKNMFSLGSILPFMYLSAMTGGEEIYFSPELS